MIVYKALAEQYFPQYMGKYLSKYMNDKLQIEIMPNKNVTKIAPNQEGKVELQIENNPNLSTDFVGKFVRP